MRSRRSNAAVAVLFLVLALVASACSSKPKSALDGLPADDLTPTIPPTTIETVASPLTGALVTPAVADRPAVIVKVDNSPAARPQAGLNEADVIYEERVEGSVVRFLAVYQSKDAVYVGPVRSIRSTDAAVVAPIGGVFAFSGGIAPFLAKIKATGITAIAESDDPSMGNYKRAGRTRPFATFANTAKLRAQSKPVAPPPLFARIRPGTSFAEANPNAKKVTSLRAFFGQLTTADWTWDATKQSFLRSTNGTPHLLEDKTRLSTGCVILQTVPYKATPYKDRTNFTVDEAVITGQGKAVVACDGYAVDARWAKPSTKSVITYTNAVTGAPITLPVGRVWVSLVPTNGEITMKSPATPTTTIGKR